MRKFVLIATKNILKNKVNLFSTILMGLLFGLSILISTFYSTMDNFINNEIKKNSAFKILLVRKNDGVTNQNNMSNDDIRRELEEIEDIDAVFSITSKYNILTSPTFKNDKEEISGIIELDAGNEKIIPKIVKGKTITDTNNNYIVCPKNFYPGNVYSKNIRRNDFINLDKYIGKNIDFEVENYNSKEKKIISYELVGLYENSKVETDEFICYVSENSLYDIFKFQRENDDVIQIDNQKGYYVEVNRLENVEKMKKLLEEKDYGVTNLAFIDYSMFDKMYKKVDKILIVFLVLIFILYICLQIKLLLENSKQYILLKYIGIKRKNLKKFILLNNNMFLILSFVFSLISMVIINIFLRILVYIKPLIFEKKVLLISYNILPKILVIALIINFFITIYNLSYIKDNG